MAQLIGLQLKNFSVALSDSFDITNYLTSFAVSIPVSEYNAAILWSGNFEIAYNQNAIAASLTTAAFSEISTPNRWRDGKQFLTLTVDGQAFYPLYIKNYEWDDQNLIGRGDLVQLPDLLNFERLAEEIERTEFSLGVSINTVVNSLLLAAGRINGTQIVNQSQINISGLQGTLCIPFISENPLSDSIQFIGSNAKFLTQNRSGVITTVDKPEYANPLFQRGIDQVVFLPRDKIINFSADKIIVLGSKDVAKLPDPSGKVDKLSDEFSKNGKPKYLRTFTKKTLGELFPDSLPGDTTSVIVGCKTIFYRYKNDQSILFRPADYLNITPVVEVAIATYPSTLSNLKSAEDDVIQTVTIEEKIVVELFSSDRPTLTQAQSIQMNIPERFKEDFQPPTIAYNSTEIYPQLFSFIVANVTVESEVYRKSFVPSGIKYPSISYPIYALKFPLVLDQEEILISKLPDRDRVSLQLINPITGLAQELESRPVLEEQNPKPELEIEPIVFKGEYNLTPNGWNTFLPKLYKEEFRFLDSLTMAQNLARKIGIREQGRFDGKTILLPVPTEWIAAGYPLFPIVDVHDARYVVENPTIVIDFESDVPQMYLKFFGEKLATIDPIPQQPAYIPFIPTGNLQIVPVSILEVLQ